MLSKKVIYSFIFVGLILIVLGIYNFGYYSMSGIIPISVGLGLLGIVGISKVIV